MKHSVENDFLKITADTHGAELVSVINKKTEKEMMWQADPKVWEWHGPVLFPYCGKLKGGKYTLDGKEYSGAQHGFIRNLEHEFESNENNQLKFIFHSNEETMKLLPREFDFETIFTLDNNTLRHSLKITNKSSKELRFGIGFHPAFALPFDEKHTTKDYELQFEIPQTVIVKENYLSGPYEGFVSGETTVLTKDSKVIPLDDHMFDNDSICLSELTAKTLSIVEKDTGKKITVNIENFPYILLWSMYGTETLKFLCIEPWHNLQDSADSNGNWNDKPCAAVLKPSESWQTDLLITYQR